MRDRTEGGSIAAYIVARAKEADRRLRENPYHRRLLAGDLSRDEYGAWLIQLHKYIHVTAPVSEQVLSDAMAVRALRGDPDAKALSDYAAEAAREETGHDELIVKDLAALYSEHREEARARIAREVDAPSVKCYRSLLDTMHARFPEGIIGIGLALQTLAILESDEIRAGLLDRGRIDRVNRAVSFLAAHSGEVEAWHADEDARSVNWLRGPKERSAAIFFAELSIALFEGISHYLADRFACEVVEEPAEIGVS